MTADTFLARHADGWHQAWAGLGARPPAALLPQLCAAYAEPHRHYHTLQHRDECLTLLAEHRGQAAHPHEVALALWFHDAVYDVQAADNEARSADWARDALQAAGVAAAEAGRVHALVMVTCHGRPEAAPPMDADTRLLLDIDLAILGAPAGRYAEYERQIRAEYAHVPAAVFEPRRRQLMAGFLARTPLYRTAALRARREAQARINLAGALR